jgi:two-component system, LytTR family, response regulator LytT
MKVLVVEEEKSIVRKLERVLKNIDDSICIIGTVPAFLAAGWLQQHGVPDIILVSKESLQEHPISLLYSSEVNTTVTFKVQSDQFTFLAFRINNLEHLFPAASFTAHQQQPRVQKGTALVNATKFVDTDTLPARQSFRHRFLVRQGQKFISIETDVIAYFFSEGRFIFFKTYDNQKYLVEYTLEDLDAMLNPDAFFRINRSLLIAFKSVEQIHPYFGNRLKLFLHPSMEKEIIVSREKVNDFKAWLGE